MSKTAALRTVSRILQEFRVIEPDMPASYAAIVLFVAKFIEDNREDPSIGDISNGLGMTRPSVSRAALALSSRRLGGSRATEERPAGGRKALGLLEREADVRDLRLTRCRLSAKGSALISRIIDLTKG